jgi:hypothetical protein
MRSTFRAHKQSQFINEDLTIVRLVFSNCWSLALFAFLCMSNTQSARDYMLQIPSS